MGKGGKMKAMKEKLPAFLYPLFWDIDPVKLNYRQYPTYVVERILELGDRKAVLWMEKTYTQEHIKSVIRGSRKISPKTGNYYAHLYGLKREEVKCLNVPFWLALH